MSPTMEEPGSEEVEFQFLDGNIIIQVMPRNLWEGKEYLVVEKSMWPQYAGIKLHKYVSKAWGERRPIFRQERP